MASDAIPDDELPPSIQGMSQEDIVRMYKKSDEALLKCILLGYSLQQVSVIHIPGAMIVRTDGDPIIRKHVELYRERSYNPAALRGLKTELQYYNIRKQMGKQQ